MRRFGIGIASPSIVLVDAGHDAQQRRLAGAVEAEHADLGAREEGQRDVLEDLALGRNDLAHAVHRVDVLSHRLGSRRIRKGRIIARRRRPPRDQERSAVLARRSAVPLARGYFDAVAGAFGAPCRGAAALAAGRLRPRPHLVGADFAPAVLVGVVPGVDHGQLRPSSARSAAACRPSSSLSVTSSFSSAAGIGLPASRRLLLVEFRLTARSGRRCSSPPT